MLIYLTSPKTPYTHLSNEMTNEQGKPRPETGRRGLPLFMDDKSAGFVVCASLLLNVLLSWDSVGFQGDAGGSVPLRVVVTATPSSESNSKRLKMNKI